jgi:hypothetical protein
MSDIEWTINVNPSRRYRLRMLLPRERRALIRRLEMAVEYGVLDYADALTSWRCEAPFWRRGPHAKQSRAVLFAASSRRIAEESREVLRRIDEGRGRP